MTTKAGVKRRRVHDLPLTEEAVAILQPMIQAEALGCSRVLTSNGSVPIVPDTLAATLSKIAKEMAEGHESRFSFLPSDIRRTVETLLASKGISRDIRAQIQSHGLSGVQVRHYDRHDYRDEKRRVLEFWADPLDGRNDAKVVPLHSEVA